MKENSLCAQVSNVYDLASALKARKQAIVLFYASWCPFCARFLPVFRKQAEGREGHFLQVLDDDEAFCDKYSIQIFPTVLFFENGVVAKRLDGKAGIGLQETQLVEFINSCLLS